jgi:cobalt-zinc-cadmium efflux system protein
VLGDALSSVGVIVAGVVILFTGWTWVDPAAGILISVIILFGAWRILKEVVHILNEGAPEGASAAEVAAAMAAVPGVVEIHDVHVWAIEANYRVMSAHVVLSDKRLSETNLVMDALKEIAAHKFDIEHTTIQFECANCGQGPVSCRAEGENA